EHPVHLFDEFLHPPISEAIEYVLRFLAPDDQARIAQFGDLLRQARLANAKRVFEIAHRAFAINERADDHQPRGVGEFLDEARCLSSIGDKISRTWRKVPGHRSSHVTPSSASSGNFRYRLPLASGSGRRPPFMFTCSACKISFGMASVLSRAVR